MLSNKRFIALKCSWEVHSVISFFLNIYPLIKIKCDAKRAIAPETQTGYCPIFSQAIAKLVMTPFNV